MLAQLHPMLPVVYQYFVYGFAGLAWLILLSIAIIPPFLNVKKF